MLMYIYSCHDQETMMNKKKGDVGRSFFFFVQSYSLCKRG